MQWNELWESNPRDQACKAGRTLLIMYVVSDKSYPLHHYLSIVFSKLK
ncbi:hypothetical protein C2W64_01623 [Brevibacillus laterosporus]|nr:hypothetical protein C2W64_01623 [Brevibacillus laterosporus]